MAEAQATASLLPGELGHAGRKTILVMVSQFAGAGLGLAGVWFTGRYVAPSSLGSYTFASLLVSLVLALGNFGVGQAHQRHVSMGEDLRKANGVLLRLRLAAYVAVGLVVVLALVVLRDGLHVPINSTTSEVLLLVVAAGALAALRQFPMDTWAGQQRVNRNEIIKFVDTVVSVLSIAVVALCVGSVLGGSPRPPALFARLAPHLGVRPGMALTEVAYVYALAYLLGKVVSMAPVLWWWWKDRLPVGSWDRDLARRYAKFAGPLALVGAIALVLQYTDGLVIGLFWGSAGTSDKLGVYSMAQRAANVAGIATMGVTAVLFPRFTALFAQGKREAALQVFRSAERYTLMATAAPVAALVGMPGLLLHIIGDAYQDAVRPLQILALGVLLGCLSAPLANKFVGSSSLRVAVVGTTLSGALNLILNLWLVPPAGAIHGLPMTLGMAGTGSALATLAASTLSYAYLRGKARSEFGLPWVELPLVRIAVAAVAAAAFWWGCAYVLHDHATRVWEVAALGVAGLGVYAGVMAALGELTRTDIRYAWGVVNPKGFLAELRGR